MRTSATLAFGFALCLGACAHSPPKSAEPVASEANADAASEASRVPSSSAAGVTLNCFGTQSNKGARATVIFKGAAKDYIFSGTRIDGKQNVKIDCNGRRDAEYKAQSANPHFDRYVVNKDERKCGYDDAFVARTIVEDRGGSFSFMGECGRGDFCSATYYCREDQ